MDLTLGRRSPEEIFLARHAQLAYPRLKSARPGKNGNGSHGLDLRKTHQRKYPEVGSCPILSRFRTASVWSRKRKICHSVAPYGLADREYVPTSRPKINVSTAMSPTCSAREMLSIIDTQPAPASREEWVADIEGCNG